MAFWEEDVILRYKKGKLNEVKIKVMKKEIKVLLEKELQDVKQSKIKSITGLGLLVVNVVFVALGYLESPTLIFTIMLLLITLNQIAELRINASVLFLTRYFVDTEFQKEYDNENK